MNRMLTIKEYEKFSLEANRDLIARYEALKKEADLGEVTIRPKVEHAITYSQAWIDSGLTKQEFLERYPEYQH